MQSANMRPTSAASARTRRSRTASACGCVSDNLRKGAALNAVQIAELLGRKHLAEGGLGLVAPVAEQVRLDELQPAEILLLHLQALERRDFVQLEQHVALEGVLHPALDEGDRDQTLALW